MKICMTFSKTAECKDADNALPIDCLRRNNTLNIDVFSRLWSALKAGFSVPRLMIENSDLGSASCANWFRSYYSMAWSMDA